jgi:UDP-N-acetylmuramoyl-L-alanyl-D-glutamate--2,6-diaminopimelate ligase
MLAQHANVEAALGWLRARGARGLASDSRTLRPGDAFIAWPGYAFDARQFVGAALAAGAVACLVEARGAEAFAFAADDRIAALAGLKAAAGELASRWFDEPSRALELVAITGTNGKTSTAWWIAQALSSLGRRAGVIGTLGAGEPPQLQPSGLTTPDPVTLQSTLRRFVDQGFTACAVEASSIGIVEERLAGTRIAVAVLTNFTQDHLDYHGDMPSYWGAKARLFAWPGLRAAVLNLDDERGAELPRTLLAVDLWTYAKEQPARLVARDIGFSEGGLAFDVHEQGARSARLQSRLIGEFNVYNLLAVVGTLRALGMALDDAVRACARLGPVPGRMQRVEGDADQPQVVVDYAHTPDALEKALLALAPFARERGGKLWCVFGCGGDRDASKRPMMGAIAERLAQHVVATSDNPRGESPSFILSQILAGVIGHDDVDVIEDRAEAIAYAVASADARDVILLAGKGHEDYQEVEGVRRPFSDALEARAALAARRAS